MSLTKQEVTQLRKIFHKLRKQVAASLLPSIEKKIAENYSGPVAPLSVMAGQAFFKDTFMAIWDDLGFKEPVEVADLTARVAAYLVTATPAEEHAKWTKLIVDSLPRAVESKVLNDYGMPVAWVMKDGAAPRAAIPGSAYDQH